MAEKKKIAGDVARKYLATAVKLPDEEDYVVLGYRIQDSSIEFNPDVEKGTDINGRGFSTVKKMELEQSFESAPMTKDLEAKAVKLQDYLLELTRNQEYDKFTQFEVVLIYGWIGEVGAYSADLHTACSVIPQNIGGDSLVNMSYNISFGGDVKRGTASGLLGEINFTETPEGWLN